MNPQSSASLRFGQRTTLTGQPGSDLASLGTAQLPNGCEVVVNQAPIVPDIFIFLKGATGGADGVNIIAAVDGGGLWFRYSFLNGNGSELDVQQVNFAVPIGPGPDTDASSTALIFRTTPGKVLVEAQFDLEDTSANDLILVQGIIDAIPSGPIASCFCSVADTPETFSLKFLATFATTGTHNLALSVTSLVGTVTVTNALLFTIGQV